MTGAPESRRPPELVIVAAGVFGAVLTLALVVFFLVRAQTPPGATGDAGFLVVFGQTEHGPIPLKPFHLHTLPRPQTFAFSFDVKGTGPRRLRVELRAGDVRKYLLSKEVRAPMDQEALPEVAPLGDNAPKRFQLITTVEAPHAEKVETVYDVELVP